MGNSRTTSINYKPRMTDYEAYELLPVGIQRALQRSVISYSSYGVYRMWKKSTEWQVIETIERANMHEAKRPLIPARGVKGRPGYKPAEPSTYVACKVPPLHTIKGRLVLDELMPARRK